jgi:hypothetical protein
VCMCVCREREGGREGGREGERKPCKHNYNIFVHSFT